MGAGEGVSSCLWEWMVRCFCETQRAAFVGRFLAWSNDAAAAGAWTWMWWRAKVKLPLPARGGETIQYSSGTANVRFQ